jgi:signal transduction histidine kinase
MRLRGKVLTVTLAAILVSGATTTVLARGVAADLITHEVENHLATTVQSRARHVDTYLRAEIDSLVEFAESVTPRALLKTSAAGQENPDEMERLRLWMAGYTQGGGGVAEVLLVDNLGKVIVSSRGVNDGINMAGSPWFKPSANEPFVHGPEVIGNRAAATLVFAAPVVDGKNGELLGRLAVVQPLKEIESICTDRTGLGTTGETYLLDRKGIMLTPSRFLDTAREPLTLTVDTHIFQIGRSSFDEDNRSAGAISTHVYTNYDGIEVIGSYAPLFEADWICVAERSTREALAPLEVLSQATTWIFVALGLLALVFSLLLSRSISRPIVSLQKGARELAAGKLGHTVDVRRKDEIGDLARSFNEMSTSLRQSHERLAQHAQEMEDAVALRTAELRNANVHLESLNSRLDASNRELQDFAYVASHDLREPLRKISSFGELLSQSLKDRLTTDERENLGFMVDGASRMQAMIDDLLTYSRVTTQAAPRKMVDLNHVLDELRTLELASRIEETGATLLVPQPLPQVYGDVFQLRQLLQNLIANALKFHRPDVPPEVAIVEGEAEEGMVCIGVRDNGIGIPAEHLEQIFTMFKRLHSRTLYEGTGIGLAVCKKIVERHGGRIWVESASGEGSTFWFTLPSSDEATMAREEGEDDGTRSRHDTVG